MLLRVYFLVSFVQFVCGNFPKRLDLEKDVANVPQAENTLIFANIIFRHGDRTPTDISTYKTDPNKYASYWLEGMGGLTKKGKLQAYKLGLELRQRYGGFLGDTYFPDLIGALSSSSSRCQTSLQCVFAAMFPPKLDNLFVDDLPWQPIVYGVLPADRDDSFAVHNCDGFWNITSPRTNKTILELYDFLQAKSGELVKNNSAVYIIHDSIASQISQGMPQPDWVDEIYPEPIKSVAEQTYQDLVDQRIRLGASGLYRRLVNTFLDKLDGKLSPPRRKMMLYSAHDITMVYALAGINAYDGIGPKYTSYLAFELHYINRSVGIKVFLQNYEKVAPVPINILGEGEFCPLEKFLEGVRWLSENSHPHCQLN